MIDVHHLQRNKMLFKMVLDGALGLDGLHEMIFKNVLEKVMEKFIAQKCENPENLLNMIIFKV